MCCIMQVRRSRQLEISFIATVVNYEYKFTWTLSQVWSHDLKLTLAKYMS